MLVTQQENFPHDHFNVGMAFGQPGIVAFLGEALAAGVEVARAP
jgi:hypothetical protein